MKSGLPITFLHVSYFVRQLKSMFVRNYSLHCAWRIVPKQVQKHFQTSLKLNKLFWKHLLLRLNGRENIIGIKSATCCTIAENCPICSGRNVALIISSSTINCHHICKIDKDKVIGRDADGNLLQGPTWKNEEHSRWNWLWVILHYFSLLNSL